MLDLNEIQDKNCRKLTRFSVGLRKQVPYDEEKLYYAAAGSGVLVSARGAHFIITAGHVVDNLLKGEVAAVHGMSTPQPTLRPYKFDPKHCDKIICWNKAAGDAGPDIAAIKLPPDAMEYIIQAQMACNLDRRTSHGLENPDIFLCGFPSEAYEQEISLNEEERKSMLTMSVMSGVRTSSQVDEQGFDSFQFDPNYIETEPLHTFEGVSGGGIWAMEADDPETIPQLVGIAFMQGERREDGNRTIYCAGPQAIYSKLVEAAVQKWSSR